jgi:hypothetical protein
MSMKRLSVIATLACAAAAGCPAHASLIPMDHRPVFQAPADADDDDREGVVAPGTNPLPMTRVERTRSVKPLDPPRFDNAERGGFFNEFIYAALGPLGKSELASSIHALGSTLKPYLESQGAYTPDSSSRELNRLTDNHPVVLAQEFNYYGVLTTTKTESAPVEFESRTRAIDPVMVERTSASEANPIMQGVISFFSQLFKSLAGLFSS